MNFIGVDIGTTRVKATIIDKKMSEIFTAWRPTPKVENRLSTIPLEKIDEVLDSLLDEIRKAIAYYEVSEIKAIAVSSQSPSICDLKDLNNRVCFTYQGRNSVGAGTNRDKTTRNWFDRIEMLTGRTMCQKVCSLAAYVNLRLGGTLSLDPITAWELGISTQEKGILSVNSTSRILVDCPILIPIAKVGVSKRSGISGAMIASGTTDSIASFIGAAQENQRVMIYAGTYGSVFASQIRPLDYLNSNTFKRPPYKWLLSIPAFGPEIARLAYDASVTLQELLEEAYNVIPNRTDKISLPWHDHSGIHGEYSLPGAPAHAAIRAIETFAHLVRHTLDLSKISSDDVILSGGLSASKKFTDLFVSFLGRPIKVAVHPHGSYGTALVAAKAADVKLTEPKQRLIYPSKDIESRSIDIAFQKTIAQQTALGWNPRIIKCDF